MIYIYQTKTKNKKITPCISFIFNQLYLFYILSDVYIHTIWLLTKLTLRFFISKKSFQNVSMELIGIFVWKAPKKYVRNRAIFFFLLFVHNTVPLRQVFQLCPFFWLREINNEKKARRKKRWSKHSDEIGLEKYWFI